MGTRDDEYDYLFKGNFRSCVISARCINEFFNCGMYQDYVYVKQTKTRVDVP